MQFLWFKAIRVYLFSKFPNFLLKFTHRFSNRAEKDMTAFKSLLAWFVRNNMLSLSNKTTAEFLYSQIDYSQIVSCSANF
jgi:hypothetical protein